MKTYEEMTKSVMDKAQTRRAAQRRRNNTLILTATCFCLLLVTAVMAGGLTDDKDSGVKLENPVVSTTNKLTITNKPTISTEIAEPRVVLLCASRDGATTQILEEKIKVPYKAQVRVRDVTGMTEEERKKVAEEEAAYISEIIDLEAFGNGYGRYSLDNVIVTTISEGQFGIKLNDIDAVARIRASVTENGMLMSYPRVEGCKTSAYTFAEDQQLLIDIDGEHLKQTLADNALDTLNLLWNLSPWTVPKIDEDPDMDLSQFRDKITIWIDYKDGREETFIISVELDSDGNVYAVLEETVIHA